MLPLPPPFHLPALPISPATPATLAAITSSSQVVLTSPLHPQAQSSASPSHCQHKPQQPPPPRVVPRLPIPSRPHLPTASLAPVQHQAPPWPHLPYLATPPVLWPSALTSQPLSQRPHPTVSATNALSTPLLLSSPDFSKLLDAMNATKSPVRIDHERATRANASEIVDNVGYQGRNQLQESKLMLFI